MRDGGKEGGRERLPPPGAAARGGAVLYSGSEVLRLSDPLYPLHCLGPQLALTHTCTTHPTQHPTHLQGVDVVAAHGDKDQQERLDAVRDFKLGKENGLCALFWVCCNTQLSPQ